MSNQDIIFSIVIPTFNRAKLLKRCLDSILAQSYQNWEAIIVDNYSEDNTEEIVMAYHDDRIKYIKNHNYGVIAVSRNKALDMASGKYICFLDSDDYWFSNKLETILPYMKSYDLVYHDYTSNLKRTRPFQKVGSHFYEVKEPTIEYVLKRSDPFSPSCTCVKAEAIGNTRFSEDKELFAVEDYDFFLQLLMKGITVKKINLCLAFYDMETGVSHSRLRINRDRKVFAKYLPFIKNAEDKRDVLKQYMRRKAGYYYSICDYKKAIHYFKISATSHAGKVKKDSLLAILKCYIFILFNKQVNS